MKYDIITFGSAISDTFLMIKKETYRISKKTFSKEKALCFPLGSKIFIEELQIFTGGGGTNTACTFSRQGLKTAYCGKIGKDKQGEAIIDDLNNFGVDTSFLKIDKNHLTAHSIILSLPQVDRTILIYRGACHFLKKQEIPFNAIKQTKWFYLAPLSEESAQIFELLVKFAKQNNIKIAVNPGNDQINLDKKILKPILSQIDILILNLKESKLLSRVNSNDEKEIIKRLYNLFNGILVITKGKHGSVVCDGKYIYQAGTPSILPLEKTGAGDAFGSGFLSGLLEKKGIEYAIQKATANAVSCIQQVGAKNGLLKRGQWGKWPRVFVNKSLK